MLLWVEARCEEPGVGEEVSLHLCPGCCSLGLAGVREGVGTGIRPGSKEVEESWKEGFQAGFQKKDEDKVGHHAAL